MISRRRLLGGLAGILAAGFAPAAIGSGVLMPVRKIIVPGDAELLEHLRWTQDELVRAFRVPPHMVELNRAKMATLVMLSNELLNDSLPTAARVLGKATSPTMRYRLG